VLRRFSFLYLVTVLGVDKYTSWPTDSTQAYAPSFNVFILRLNSLTNYEVYYSYTLEQSAAANYMQQGYTAD
jgi:hypothetical protein